MTVDDIPIVNRRLKAEFYKHEAPVMDLVAAQTEDPFRILVGTILSARTRDECTAAACDRLFEVAKTPAELEQLDEATIAKLIYPVGFYKTKAKHLKKLPGELQRLYGGVLPETVEELYELPGVGRKTANLVVAIGFKKPAICVDVHVHRICNRLGLVDTKTPLETEMELRRILPLRYWIGWNSYVVAFGQTRCTPRKPKCQGCPIYQWCERRGVTADKG